MPAYHIERSIVIEKPIKEVRDSLKNFKAWPKWSPWIVMEPDATVTYSDRQGQVGASYGWSGVLIGAGGMELMEVHDDELKMQLTLMKPFKSQADVGFRLSSEGESTHVTWYMDGSLPFFMFWMTGKMKAYIGMDYSRGLSMLKEYLETGDVASYVHIEGVMPVGETEYIAIPTACSIDDLGSSMQENWQKLYAFIEEHKLSMQGVPFSIFHTFDIVKHESTYFSCIPVTTDMPLQDGWVRGTLKSEKTLKTMHKGRYMHLGNAWMTAMNFARMKKMKTKKSPVGYEFYLNNPNDTAEEALITEIYMPLK